MPNQPIYFKDELLQKLKKESNMSSLINTLLIQHYKNINISIKSLIDLDLALNKIADEKIKVLEERTKFIKQEEERRKEEDEKIRQEEIKIKKQLEDDKLYTEIKKKDNLTLDDLNQVARINKNRVRGSEISPHDLPTSK